MCWASTSSGDRGITVASIARSRISLVTTAHSTRSALNFGNRRPFETCDSVWPARPTRCSPRATDFGDSICTTRSTAPMSMPSSSELVATRHLSRPDLSSSSISVRASRDSEPWWERATGSSARSLRRNASRSARRRLLTNTIVELCSRTISSTRG